jgi:putative ABC transport system ATP-binding protein
MTHDIPQNRSLIRLIALRKSFFTDEVETRALDDLDLTIRAGEYVSFSGPSGCGKSTLLGLLGLLDTPTSGLYMLGEQDVSTIGRNDRARIRNREIGFVFQSFNLISDMTVAENVALPLSYRKDLNTARIQELVDQALHRVDMSHRAKHFPSQLSGGQQQRIAVARAVVSNPALILADEPTGNLDSKNAETVTVLLEKLHADGATICIVTHNPDSAARAQRQVELLDGRIVHDSFAVACSE